MARTKTTVVTQKKDQTRAVLRVPAAGLDTSIAPIDVRRRENDGEETKQGDAADENNPDSDHEEHGDPPDEERRQTGDDDGSSITAAPMAALTAALQQMTATMTRIDARLDQLSASTSSDTATATLTAAPTPNLAQTTSTTQSVATQPSSTTIPERQVTYQPHGDDDNGGDSSGNDEASSSSDNDDSSSSDDGERRRERRQPVTLPGDRDFHRNRRLDLALEGARFSGRGDWTDHELYYILGNKLQDSAARWWVQLDRKLRDNERTWTRLKSSLLRRYGERLDKAMTEWRVDQRPPDSYVVPACGTTGHMAIIPGVGSAEVREEEKLAFFTNSRGIYNKYTGLWEAPKGRTSNGHMWAPTARKRMAPTTAVTTMKRPMASRTEKKAKVSRAVATNDYVRQSDDDEEAGVAPTPPPAKKTKSTTRRAKAVTRQVKGVEAPRMTGGTAQVDRRYGEPKCYACNRFGHMARECPDDEARTRNEEYLAKRRQEAKLRENGERVADGCRDDSETDGNSQTQPSDESVAAIRGAIAARVDEELTAHDKGRAERYVSTVRPAMTAQRYVHAHVDDGRNAQGGGDVVECKTTEELATATSTTPERATTTCEGVSTSEEGDMVTSLATITEGDAETSAMELGTELTDEAVMELGSIAKVRLAMRRARRDAKHRRIQRAREKADKRMSKSGEIARAVAKLDEEQQLRRQRQANEARSQLAERRRQRADDNEVRADERVRVNLVKLGSTETPETTENDVRVEASDGLPPAMMIIDGV
ncbi:unnamed protein product [Phytophthora fragariaefolia]|uniref:Unnamed protein product n=1 Tax=Phytophthora fragariaefolia TaxID=1490495 RepID=A0A9W6Y4F1_9STRA|nr:unnamed protein product [Phytophthora fragariaefolia]